MGPLASCVSVGGISVYALKLLGEQSVEMK